MIKNILGGKTEVRVIEDMKKHIRILRSASECFKKALETQDRDQIYCIPEMEREGDTVRREIISGMQYI